MFQQPDACGRKVLGEGGVIVDVKEEEEEEEEWETDDASGSSEDADLSNGDDASPLPLPARKGVRFAAEEPVFADDRSAASSSFR